MPRVSLGCKASAESFNCVSAIHQARFTLGSRFMPEEEERKDDTQAQHDNFALCGCPPSVAVHLVCALMFRSGWCSLFECGRPVLSPIQGNACTRLVSESKGVLGSIRGLACKILSSGSNVKPALCSVRVFIWWSEASAAWLALPSMTAPCAC